MPTLNWIGKEKIIHHHLDVPYRVLNHNYGFTEKGKQKAETGSGNKIIHGDNLEALKSLLPEYEGKVKCIYIDPPYNTGNEGWVYNDNVSHPKLQKWLGETVGKESEDLTRHDKWLCMMYPRLQLLHRLLADDGAIFISIDDHEQANLRVTMNEIFGVDNFINNIIWQKKFSPQNDAKFFSDNHDFIICYCKKKTQWKRNLLKRTQKQNLRYKNIDNDPRGAWTSGDLSVKTYSLKTDFPITIPSGRIVNPPAGYCWRFTQEKFQELVHDNRIWFGPNGDNVPRLKRFLIDVQDGSVPLTIWPHEDVGHNQSAKQELKKIFVNSKELFDTPKPYELIRRIIEISCNSDSIILDSFAGSGTTAHAVLNLNKQDGGKRKFILIELEDYTETITGERVKRVIKGYGDVEGTGGSFDFYTVGEPLFDDQHNLNEAIPTEKIREYIWYSETRNNSSIARTNSPFLGIYNDTGYYFIYKKKQLTTLDYDTLAEHITEKSERYIIYADNCLLPESFMRAKNIEFKKIPRNITRF